MLKYGKEITEANFEESIICYIDVLGATAAIEQDDISFFNSLKDIFLLLNNLCDIPYHNENYDYYNVKIKAFSDNIIFVYPLSEKPAIEELNRGFNTIVFLAAMFQYFALNKKILVRGGITIGKICFDEFVVWGKSLVDAYKLENKVAIFPRIVIDEKIVKLNFFENDELKEKKSVFKDFDGQYFIGFFFSENEIFLCDDIKNCQRVMDEMKNKFANDVRIMQKLSWIQTYIDRCKKENGLTDSMIEETVKMFRNQFLNKRNNSDNKID